MDQKAALWASGRDEEVQVNQRALIDKVLARYSGEHTVLRELLQNSDDASAKSVEIHFNTKAYLDRQKGRTKTENNESESLTPPQQKLPDLKKELLAQWEFKNDGIPFRPEDWDRLKKIAEGNPDEEKIGAFGVGFYSLFSVTDEPFVTSGGEWMGFYWKDGKDQLFARRGTLASTSTSDESAQIDPWTSFAMPLREPSTFPGRPIDIARFLATSLTFMRNLKDVSMFFDEHRLVRITKSIATGKTLSPPTPNLDPRRTATGMMRVKNIESHDLRMKASVLRWVYTVGSEKPAPRPPIPTSTRPVATSASFFSSLFSSLGTPSAQVSRTPSPAPVPIAPPPNPLEALESSVTLTMYTATVQTSLTQKMLGELERATKKRPPAICSYSLIYTGKDEYDMSVEQDEKERKATGSVFQGLRADLDGSGSSRVFIGHATSQSTGVGGHISARFIPTVERESIDLVDRQVSVWNRELLWVGGYLCRFVHDLQQENIRALWAEAIGTTASDPSNETLDVTKKWLEGKSIHVMKFFSFQATTPSPVVGLDLEAAFFQCTKDTSETFPIMSTTGIKPLRQVRAFSPEFRAFLKTTPMIAEAVNTGAPRMIEALRQRGMIRDITFTDVLEELSERPLSETEMAACLKWRISLDTAEARGHDEELRRRFLEAAILVTRDSLPGVGDGEERIVPLSTIKTFLSPGNVIPPTVPLPQDTLPFSLGKQFKSDSFGTLFHWSDLSICDWLAYLVSSEALRSLPPRYNITQSPDFAERVLAIVAKALGTLYLPKAQLANVIELLKDKTVVPTRNGLRLPGEAYFMNANVFPDLPIISFSRSTVIRGNLEVLLEALGVMKHVNLQIVFNRMINTGDWGVQELVKYLVAVRDSLSPEEVTRLRQTAAFPRESMPGKRSVPGDLYEPTDALRVLGLPLLDWTGTHKWRSNSPEAKLMYDLGLQRFPPLDVLLKMASTSDETSRTRAMQYLLDNMDIKYFTDWNTAAMPLVAFIPAIKADGTPFLAMPNEVYTDPDCAILDFATVRPDFKVQAETKLKLPKHPPIAVVMPIITRKPTNDPDSARKIFEWLTSRIADFSEEQFKTLQNTPIVPVVASKSYAGADDSYTLRRPSECFFRGESSRKQAHSSLFTYIDFGSKANSFLRACGVKAEPTVQEIAEILIRDPRRFLELAGGPQGYLDELRQIAVMPAYPPQLLVQMKRSAFLLASHRSAKAVPPQLTPGDEGEEEYDLSFDLLRADQIVINDDTNAWSLFNDVLNVAPQEDMLEAFYQYLGSPRLSALVTEEYKPSNIEASMSPPAAEVRNLVIQRFPLFLHERNAKCKVPTDWLGLGTNLQVRGCTRLNLVKKLTLNGKQISKTQDASAAAQIKASFGTIGPLTLFISLNDKLDMYEVANSICKLLLKKPSVNDSLLFMTILSTDLRALRRRGFNVDRILNQQKAERDLRAAKMASGPKASEAPLATLPGKDPATENYKGAQGQTVEPPSKRPLAGANDLSTLEPPPSSSRSRNPAASVINSFKNKIHRDRPGSGATPFGASSQTRATQEDNGDVTSTGNIERNVQTALDACRTESSSVLQNRKQMSMVKESLDEGYCDISGTDKDFDLIGSIDGYKFYVARDVPNPQQIAAIKQTMVSRFATAIINPLAAIYKLRPSSIHIFYDQRGGLIAFNRNGSLFLNLRYYESWHDAEVLEGRLEKALVSWYHSLAHEIAHNLVQPHNSEHEFYFSAICETHLLALTGVLNKVMTR